MRYLDRRVYIQDVVTQDGQPPSRGLADLTSAWLRKLGAEMADDAWVEPFPVPAMPGDETDRATALLPWQAFLPRGALEDA